MKLMTKTLKKAFPKLYSMDGKKPEDIKVVAKYFNPTGSGTWYITEFDGEDTMYGLCVLHESEMGYVSLKELESFKGNGFGIERDLYFKGWTLAQAMDYENYGRGNMKKFEIPYAGAPNEILYLSEDGGRYSRRDYVSYCSSTFGSRKKETALYIAGVRYILNGDFRKEYLEVDGIDAYLKVYESFRDEFRSEWSTDNFKGKEVSEIKSVIMACIEEAKDGKTSDRDIATSGANKIIRRLSL